MALDKHLSTRIWLVLYHAGIRVTQWAEGPEAPTVLNEVLLNEMERVPEPALLYLPGGRIAAVNRTAARLAGGRLLIRSDLPFGPCSPGGLTRP